MKWLTLLIALSSLSCNSTQVEYSDTPINHDLWDSLVKKYVTEAGLVDYKGFLKDREKLQQYLNLLSNNHPNPETWTKKERLAYWINAYNAFTVELILKNYPLKSIKDISLVNSPWKIEFIEIGGKKYDLDYIEHEILRKEFDEPRIHFAINCASMSCPKMRKEAYTAEKLESQLDDQAKGFINDPSRNVIRKDEVKLSKIFKWFTGDFTKDKTLIGYINQYSETKINPDAKISYLEYDWSLNEE